jgi:glycosyltransferase involved in cell wall biosynthesis
MSKLSIIVPIYNVEQYLHKCVDSLLNQDIDDYEIILVDDGSPDACPQICDNYVAAHKNIRVVHRMNGGLSAARNSGIEFAQGEFIMFVDSDDYIEPNVLGGLIAKMELDNLDVLRYNYKNVNEQYEIFHPNKDPKRDVDYSEFVTDGEDFLNNRLGPGCYAWQFIIKRELLDDCSFKEGIYFEDTEWTPRMLLRAKRISSTPMVVYNYLWRSGSITLPTDQVKRKKVVRDKIALLYGFKEQQKLVKDPKWFTWMTSFTAMSILEMIVVMPRKERRYYLRELYELRIFPLATMKAHGIYKRKIQLANISPVLYCSLMSLRK